MPAFCVVKSFDVFKNGQLCFFACSVFMVVNKLCLQCFEKLSATALSQQFPFGLAMAGISSRASGAPENKYKYNKGSELQHNEFSNGSGLEMYDTHYRQLDPQIGRWNQIDPKADSAFSFSPYVSMSDNPILRNDPLGDQDSTKPADTKQAYYPAPKTLPGFPGAGTREYNQQSVRYCWKLKDGTILEWDKQHGEVEVYDKSGKNHKGAFDPKTGTENKPGDKSRSTSKIEQSDNSMSWSERVEYAKSQYTKNYCATCPPAFIGSNSPGISSVDPAGAKMTLNAILIIVSVALVPELSPFIIPNLSPK